MEDIPYEEFEKELFKRAKEIGIEMIYIDKSNYLEKNKLKDEQGCLDYPNRNVKVPYKQEEKILKNILNRAIFLEGIYNEAKIKKIPSKYIDKQVKGGPVACWGVYSMDMPDLGKMGKKEHKKIIRNAKEMYKKARKLESKVYMISSLLIILLSSFLFSPNFTGKTIVNFQTLTGNIISIFLFCGGLILILVGFKKYKKK